MTRLVMDRVGIMSERGRLEKGSHLKIQVGSRFHSQNGSLNLSEFPYTFVPQGLSYSV